MHGERDREAGLPVEPDTLWQMIYQAQARADLQDGPQGPMRQLAAIS